MCIKNEFDKGGNILGWSDNNNEATSAFYVWYILTI